MDKLFDYILALEDIYDYSETLERIFKDYKGISNAHKKALNVILTVATPITEDRDGTYIILYDDIVKRGVDYRTAMDALESYPLFIYTGNKPSHIKGIAKVYEITEEGQQVFMQELSDHWRYFRKKGSKGKAYAINRLPRAIRGVSIADYSHKTHLDVEALKEHIKSQGGDIETHRMLNIVSKCGGVFDIEYARHSEGGRLFCTNGASMQNLSSDARSEAYKGMFMVDFQNAHYAIAYQLMGGETIKHYVDNTKSVREEAAKRFKLPVSDIKTIFLMLVYNASFSGKEETHLTKIFGEEKMLEIKSDPYIKSLRKELKGLDKMLPEMWWEDYPRERSLMLQKIEARMLDVCISEYTPELLLFDGFITQEDVDTHHLSSLVYEKTGYKVVITKEVI